MNGQRPYSGTATPFPPPPVDYGAFWAHYFRTTVFQPQFLAGKGALLADAHVQH